jgi:hypothetical protein
MAAPIGATPVLTGEDARTWWEKVEKEKNQRFYPVPTPKLEEVRREILANAKKSRKK